MATQVTLNSGSVDSAGSLALKTNGTTTAITINSSQGVEFNAGTAALPAITTSGDTNTGIFFPAADTIAFAEGGVEAVRIDSSGNVGIGTSSGTRKLNVYGGASSTRTMTVTSNASEGLEVGVNASNIATINSAAGGAIIFTQADTERARIDSSGNLQFNSGYGSVATAYGCRAWVNFNGTGTVAIRASGNVSSITDNGVGNYSVIFSNSITDANFSAVASSSLDKVIRVDIYSTGAVRVVTDAATTDASIVSVAIFR